MQRIELRLIFFPDEVAWRIYSGDHYRPISHDLSDLHAVIADILGEDAKAIKHMAEEIRFSNPHMNNPTKEQ